LFTHERVVNIYVKGVTAKKYSLIITSCRKYYLKCVLKIAFFVLFSVIFKCTQAC